MSGDLRLVTDLSGFTALHNMIAAAGSKAPLALARAVNHTGGKAGTQIAKVLVKQTGLPYSTTRNALRQRMVRPGRSGSYVISSGGGYIRLKFFKAHEARKGVTAAPRNKRTYYQAAFIKGGLPENRVDLHMGGNVFRRVAGAKRYPIEVVRSDVRIPDEMVTGESAAAFHAVVQRDLPDRLGHELARLLG